MARQPVTRRRAARGLALRRRLAVIWSVFAVVALVASGLWLSVGVAGVSADTWSVSVVGGSTGNTTGDPVVVAGEVVRVAWTFAITVDSPNTASDQARCRVRWGPAEVFGNAEPDGNAVYVGNWTKVVALAGESSEMTVPEGATSVRVWCESNGDSYLAPHGGTWTGTLVVVSGGPSPAPSLPPCLDTSPSWFVGLPVPSASAAPCATPLPSASPPTLEECGGLPSGLPHDYYYSRGFDPVLCASSYVPALCFYYNDLGSGSGPWGNARKRVCDPGEAPGSYSWGWCSGPAPSGDPGASADPSPSADLYGRRPCAAGERPSWWSLGTGLTPAGQNVEYWPLSGGSCVGGKPGYMTMAAVETGAFPGLTLDVGLYAQWMGGVVGAGVVTLGNVLRSVWDVAADFVMPCPAAVGESFGGFMDGFRTGPFGSIGGTTEAIRAGLSGGPAVPFTSFAVFGHTVQLPLTAIAADAAPIRPYLVPVVWFAVALRVLSMLSSTMKGPAPTGWLAESTAGM